MSTPTGRLGRTSAATWVIRRPVPCSKPLARLTTGTSTPMADAAAPRVDRNPWVGTPATTRSAPSTAASRSSVASNPAGRSYPSRYRRLPRPAATSAATSGRRDHSTVGTTGANSAATVVPQDPAPTTATRSTDRTAGPEPDTSAVSRVVMTSP